MELRLHDLARRLLLPAAFRRRFGDQSREDFADLLAEARRRGAGARLRLLSREIGGMVGFAWRERAGDAAPAPPTRGRAPGGASRAPGPSGGLGGLFEDARFALRLLRKEPLYTVTAVITLVVGLTVTGGAWALVRGALLRPLPFRADRELVQIWSLTPSGHGPGTYTVSAPDYLEMRRRSTTLVDVAAHNRFSAIVEGVDGDAERFFGGIVTTNLFELLGVVPALGRGLTPEHGVEGKDDVVLLSHGYWRTRFAADPGVVGTRLTVNGEARTVLGVLPAGFQLPDPHSPLDRVPLYVPFAFSSRQASDHGSRYLRLVGRLREGATAEAATDELESIAADIAARHPETNKGVSAVAVPLREEFFGALRPMLLLVQGAALTVLIIALANLSNLTLVRGKRRRGELAIRAALGAGRIRLTRQMITEGLVLAAASGSVSAVVLIAGRGTLSGLAGSYLPSIARIEVDPSVLAVVGVLAALAGTFLGLLAAADLGRRAERGLVQEAGRVAGRVSARMRSGLVMAEIAFALTLVLSAGLLARSLLSLTSMPTGFDPEGVLTLDVTPPRDVYGDAAAVRAYYAALSDRLADLPGVRAVAAVSDLPFVSEDRSRDVDFVSDPVPTGEEPSVEYRTVTAGYFHALAIPLLAGRTFAAEDGPDTGPVLVVNEAFARAYGGGVASTPGLRLRMGLGGEEPSVLEVVGVVGDERDDGFGGELEPLMYLSHEQLPVRGMTVLLRADGDPSSLVEPARRIAREIDSRVAVTGVRPLRELMVATLAEERLSVVLAGVSALLGLMLAGVGVYGVMGFRVASRTREIGVRTALGARPARVVGEVLRESLALTGAGIALGLLGGLLAARWLSALLFGVGPLDPVTYVTAPCVLALVALLASVIPARRAARVSPVTALRG